MSIAFTFDNFIQTIIKANILHMGGNMDHFVFQNEIIYKKNRNEN